ncbi:MAG: TPM domain-containing protein [Proteobacteria bacterium]|nr:TPM domain-containing protein [Pseudomonadota bacterium]
MPGMAGNTLIQGQSRTWRWAALTAVGLLASATLAVSPPPRAADVPAVAAPFSLSGHVVDRANILVAQDKANLEARLEKLEIQAGPQFVVVTTPGLGGRKIEDYSLDLGRSWGVGDRKRNDGVILLVAPAERQVRIEVGYGLESTLSDPRCAEIIESQIIPRMKTGDLNGGTIAGANAIIDILRANPTLPQGKQTT